MINISKCSVHFNRAFFKLIKNIKVRDNNQNNINFRKILEESDEEIELKYEELNQKNLF